MKRQFSALLLVGILTIALGFASGTASMPFTTTATVENDLSVETFSSPLHLFAEQWERDFTQTPWMGGEVVSYSAPSIGAGGHALSPFTFYPADRGTHSSLSGTHRRTYNDRGRSVQYFIFALRKIRI